MHRKSGNRIAWAGTWGRQYQNPRYAALLPRLTNVDKWYVEMHAFWVIRGVRRRIWLPLLAFFLGRRYPLIFSTELWQIPFLRAKVVLDMDDPFFSPEEVSALNRPNVAAVVVTLESMRKRYVELGLRRPIEVIPQGVELDPVDREKVNQIRNQYSEGRDSLIVGLHQPKFRLSSEDRQGDALALYTVDLLLSMMESCRAMVPKMLLWLIGEPSPEVSQYASRNPWVKLLGSRDRSILMNYVSAFDIGVFPRPSGGLIRSNIKVLDYMACGIPVIGFEAPGMDFAVAAGGGFAARNRQEFENRVVQCAGDPDLRRKLGERGQTAVKPYTWDLVAAKYRDYLERIAHPDG